MKKRKDWGKELITIKIKREAHKKLMGVCRNNDNTIQEEASQAIIEYTEKKAGK